MRKTLLISLLWPVIAICQTPPAGAPAAAGRDQQCQDILKKALKDKNPDTRKQAAIALSLVGPTGPFPSQLESLLDDKDVEVRLAAVASISDLKNSRTDSRAAQSSERRSAGGKLRRRAIAVGATRSGRQEGAALDRRAANRKASSGYFAKQKRDALRMMHTPKTMFLFAVKDRASVSRRCRDWARAFLPWRRCLSDPSVSGRATAITASRKGQRPGHAGRAEGRAER